MKDFFSIKFWLKMKMCANTNVFDLIFVELTTWRVAVKLFAKDFQIPPNDVNVIELKASAS